MRQLSRSPNDRGVLPIVDRDDCAVGFLGQIPCLLEFHQIQQQRFLTKNIPSSGEGIEHRFAMKGRRCADIGEIDFNIVGEFFDVGECGDCREKFPREPASLISPIDHRDDFDVT